MKEAGPIVDIFEDTPKWSNNLCGPQSAFQAIFAFLNYPISQGLLNNVRLASIKEVCDSRSSADNLSQPVSHEYMELMFRILRSSRRSFTRGNVEICDKPVLLPKFFPVTSIYHILLLLFTDKLAFSELIERVLADKTIRGLCVSEVPMHPEFSMSRQSTCSKCGCSAIEFLVEHLLHYPKGEGSDAAHAVPLARLMSLRELEICKYRWTCPKLACKTTAGFQIVDPAHSLRAPPLLILTNVLLFESIAHGGMIDKLSLSQEIQFGDATYAVTAIMFYFHGSPIKKRHAIVAPAACASKAGEVIDEDCSRVAFDPSFAGITTYSMGHYTVEYISAEQKGCFYYDGCKHDGRAVRVGDISGSSIDALPDLKLHDRISHLFLTRIRNRI
jgi:hypothetical protein